MPPFYHNNGTGRFYFSIDQTNVLVITLLGIISMNISFTTRTQESDRNYFFIGYNAEYEMREFTHC